MVLCLTILLLAPVQGESHICHQKARINTHINHKYNPYIDDFLHVIPSRLLIADETLKTNDNSQKKLTTLPNDVFESGSENCRVVAVTLEKNVAMVVIFTYRVVALSFSSARNVGRAKEGCVSSGPNLQFLLTSLPE